MSVDGLGATVGCKFSDGGLALAFKLEAGDTCMVEAFPVILAVEEG